jgi:enoyl-CoA hydratase/carnithine racemase
VYPSEFQQLIYTVEDGVAWLQMNRPEARNAFSSRLYGEVKWGVRAAEADPEVDIMVLTGVDKSFASGGDLKETLATITGGGDPRFEMYRFTDNLPWDAIRLSTKPIIAAINGFAYAGGLITAAWCDISIAVASARFCLSEGKVGIVDSQACSVLFGRVGAQRFKYLYLTAKPFTAEEAERWGFITEVVPDGTLRDRVLEVVKEIRGTSPVAHRMLKRYTNELVPRPWDHGGGEAFASKEIIEGLGAFGEKRPPDYSRERD